MGSHGGSTCSGSPTSGKHKGLVNRSESSKIAAAGPSPSRSAAPIMPWKDAVAVRNTEPRVDESAGSQILFPVAVGAIFVAMLLMGALFG
jgi:hypothetical protein